MVSNLPITDFIHPAALYSWSNGIYIIIGRNHFGKMVAWSHRGRWAADSPEASPPGPPAVVPGQCRLAR